MLSIKQEAVRFKASLKSQGLMFKIFK